LSRGISIRENLATGGRVRITPSKDLYEYGDEVSIEAIPDSGYAFLGWGGRLLEGREGVVSIALSDHLELQPLFAPTFVESDGAFSVSGDRSWTYWSEGEGISFSLDDLYRGETSTLVKRAIGPGAIAFRHAHNGTDGNGWSQFYIDGVAMYGSNPPEEGEDHRFEVGEGKHVFKWEYRKNVNESLGFAATVSEMKFVPGFTLNIEVEGSGGSQGFSR